MFRLNAALTLYPRVTAQDAGSGSDIFADVLVERFFVSPHGAEELLDACVFQLSVVRSGRVEESIFCTSYAGLERQLINAVHGGSELAFGEHWKGAAPWN